MRCEEGGCQRPLLENCECVGAEILQIDRIVCRAKIVDCIVLVSVGIGYRQVFESVGAAVGAAEIAAPKLVRTVSADYCIVSSAAVDGVAPRASPESVFPIVAKNSVIAGTPEDVLAHHTI